MSSSAAPFIGIQRHRLSTDGQGITTLAAFSGCPLRCRYCLNPQSLSEKYIWRKLTPEELLSEVEIDNLYFLATNGGVTFGGGEPLLRAGFISDFHKICNPEWRINIETSLNVPTENLALVEGFVSQLIVDIKDMDSEIYKNYTGKDNSLTVKNLNHLKDLGLQSKVRIRIPRIPKFNTESNIQKSLAAIKDLGFEDVDVFGYVERSERLERKEESVKYKEESVKCKV